MTSETSENRTTSMTAKAAARHLALAEQHFWRMEREDFPEHPLLTAVLPEAGAGIVADLAVTSPSTLSKISRSLMSLGIPGRPMLCELQRAFKENNQMDMPSATEFWQGIFNRPNIKTDLMVRLRAEKEIRLWLAAGGKVHDKLSICTGQPLYLPADAIVSSEPRYFHTGQQYVKYSPTVSQSVICVAYEKKLSFIVRLLLCCGDPFFDYNEFMTLNLSVPSLMPPDWYYKLKLHRNNNTGTSTTAASVSTPAQQPPFKTEDGDIGDIRGAAAVHMNNGDDELHVQWHTNYVTRALAEGNQTVWGVVLDAPWEDVIVFNCLRGLSVDCLFEQWLQLQKDVRSTEAQEGARWRFECFETLLHEPQVVSDVETHEQLLEAIDSWKLLGTPHCENDYPEALGDQLNCHRGNPFFLRILQVVYASDKASGRETLLVDALENHQPGLYRAAIRAAYSGLQTLAEKTGYSALFEVFKEINGGDIDKSLTDEQGRETSLRQIVENEFRLDFNPVKIELKPEGIGPDSYAPLLLQVQDSEEQTEEDKTPSHYDVT